MSVSAESPSPKRVVALDPTHELFRTQAIQAYQREHRVAPVLRVTSPSAWGVLVAVVVALVTAAAFAAFHPVELTAEARGTLGSPESIHTVLSPLQGEVAEIRVAPGALVTKGEVLMTLSSTDLEAELARAKRKLERARSRLADLESVQRTLYERQLRLLRSAVAVASARSSQGALHAKEMLDDEHRIAALRSSGLLDQSDIVRARALLNDAHISELLSRQQGLAIELDSVRAEQDFHDRHESLLDLVVDAESTQGALERKLAAAVLVAPAAGYVDELLVQQGVPVGAGAVLARIVPSASALQATVFIPEQHRAFLQVGGLVQLELDQLPREEFGLLGAKIVRVGQRIASASELQRLGQNGFAIAGALYRVDLELADGPERARLAEYLRNGGLVTARFSLRKRRILSLLFDPLRRWFE